MSTRCQIGIYRNEKDDLKKFDVLLYRHSDGYPSGVLPEIMPFLAKFSRVGDVEYCGARLCQYLCNMYDAQTAQISADIEKTKVQPISLETFNGVLGNGISKNFHSDIEYFYAIRTDIKIVEVYDVGYSSKDIKITDLMKKIVTIPIQDYQDNFDYQSIIKE